MKKEGKYSVVLIFVLKKKAYYIFFKQNIKPCERSGRELNPHLAARQAEILPLNYHSSHEEWVTFTRLKTSPKINKTIKKNSNKINKVPIPNGENKPRIMKRF